ncbi:MULTISPECIES: DEAD/DEAH box helicase [unclassified Acidovorax]|jgi:superfamily II DNA/RNA helicase|uniref:DEAD/DEAH box helicase n=2 Tax=Acidovorax TaxID=12916 RepID=UPI000BC675F9|nr:MULTISPECIES: DEAD/DEAH box helicase [unclassified Acidovorax]HQS20023.1 DEAD/DEAH box helicase [Acidovorax defluvii]OYY29522.1 MAG: ATP-dependent RNA helicase [Acidovorax sp. 35-64-16]OYZ44241.1 MAG: ATP-dependent RNA helicase [Acidovorax sp. 16-64-162]OYZ70530.1 MAG: ATP-dependent RNA helicase [Acidovorax sp. 24-64-9]OZA71115.1 MAG: ATP-dependent RNA helicase [Acidovorax sp. 39-64-12]
MTSSFSNLSLAEPLARAVAEMGYESMTPIQEQAIPVVLTGQDVMGAAQTGTGKTAAFSLPLLQRLLKHESSSTSPARHPVRALVLLPTRELADQVAQQIALYAKYTKLRSTVVFGGMDMKPQTIELKKGVEVLVATPGRLLDHIEAKNAVLNQVEYVVLDEADRMLDIGFLPDLQRILSYLPKQRTTLLFSATFSPEIKRLAGSYLQNPITIEVARPNETASTVEQRFYSANDDDKRRAIHQVLRTRGIKQAFIFVNSKLGCARLARSLEREGLKTTALHGDKSQDERLKALDAFKQGEVDLLVCTDVAARGLDIKDVPAVFNFDVPFNAEDYVHRIGRTGRAGASGLAVTLVSGSDARLVADIEKLLKTKLDIEALEYDEDRPNIQQQGRINDGRRAWREAGASAEPRNDAARRDAAPRERERREPREPREYRGFRPAVASRDPFFEKPYESSTADVAPAWEAAAKSPARSGVSANIKPKRKVAALFKAVPPETAVAAQPQPETSAQ